MQWESFSDFIHLGGFGFWVWMAWGGMLAAFVIEQIGLVCGRRNAWRELAKAARRDRAQKSTAR